MQVSQGAMPVQSPNDIPDLIVEVPLDNLGRLDSYKYCLPKSSVLQASEAKQVDAAQNPSCELKKLSNQTEEVNEESLKYLFDVITKYIAVQHAANMIMFYDSKTNFLGASQALKTISEKCGLKNSREKEILRDLFLQSTKSSKKCLLSPSKANLTLRLVDESSAQSLATVAESNNLDKSKLSKGNLFGYLKYGIFDYWTTNLFQFPENTKSTLQGKAVEVNWPINFSLSETTLQNCSLESFYKRVVKQEIKFSDLSSCALLSN